MLEISINGGPFLDIIAAGGSFIAGGYNSAITVTDSVLTVGRHGLGTRVVYHDHRGPSGGFLFTECTTEMANGV